MADQFASNVKATLNPETGPNSDSEFSNVSPTSTSKENTSPNDAPCSEKKNKEEGETEWVDMTEAFRTMSLTLRPGELLHDGRFTLLDSMTAVEFMDPRMDLYVRSEWPPHGPVTVAESLDNLARLEGFSEAEVVGVVDELLALTATWLEGHTLAQTVFTCVYMHHPARVRQPLLRALLVVLGACVEHLRRTLDRAEVCIEDDHQTVTLGLPTEVPAQLLESSLACLKEEEDTLQHALKKAARTSKTAGQDVPAGGIPLEQVLLKQALLARVRLLRLFWGFLVGVVGSRPRGGGSAGKALIAQCITACEDVQGSLHLGRAFEGAGAGHLEERGRLGFDDAVNNAILPPSPRQVTVMSRSRGVEYLLSTLQGFQEAARICELTSLRDIQCAVIQLCSSPTNIANVTVRSFLNNALHCLFAHHPRGSGGGGRQEEEEEETVLEGLIRQDIRSLSHPVVLNPREPLSSQGRVRELVGEVLAQLAQPVQDLVLLHCAHRSLHQDRIAYCLGRLGELQLELEAGDHFLQEVTRQASPPRDHPKAFSGWLLRAVLALMVDFVNVGLELRLYTLCETHCALWYLDYLYGCLSRILGGAKAATEREWSQASKSGKQKAKLKKNAHHKDLEREIQLTAVKKMMCSALLRAMEAAAADNKLPPLGTTSPREELRYRHRFAAFAFISAPRARVHAEYLQDLTVSTYSRRHANLFELASKGFQAAKTSLEGLPPSDTTRSLLKIVKTNLVVCNVAVTGRHREDKSLLSLDYSVHKHFPILKLL